MENRRLLIAFFLSALVLIVWNHYLLTTQPPPESLDEVTVTDSEPPEGEVQGESPTGGSPPSGLIETSDASGALPEAESVSLIDFGADLVEAPSESTIVLDSAAARATFTNRGAQLLSLRIKDQLNAAGEPLELVRPRGRDPYPFALVVGGTRSHTLNRALFDWQEGTEDGLPTLRFRHKSDLGAAEKIFRWTEEGLLAVEITVEGETSDWGFIIGPGVRRFEEGEKSSRLMARQASWRRGAESDTINPEKTDEDVFVRALGLDWVTLEDNFFLNAVIPRDGLREVVFRPVLQRAEVRSDEPRYLPIDTDLDEEGSLEELMLLIQATGPRVGILSFFGAKQYERLAALPYGLEETVRWGSWLGVLVRPLYFALDWSYERIIPNYGWAIVLVTCFIRVLFLPLTFKSQMSMMKMQELNPKVQAIRTKFRGKLKDKQGRPNLEAQRQQNDEIMKLYKSAGVNPVSGCFPVLLQMPVFFALYRLLSTTVELRGAPWLLWIQDLSERDPWLILPLLMAVTSFLMQRMMPQAPDPMQRRMMQMMPIMFSFIAIGFPSGLVLYWVTNNLWTMLQQALMNRMKRLKTDSGKTDDGKVDVA